MDKEQNRFNYTYSAKDMAELKKIKEKYSVTGDAANTDKMAQIRSLDASVAKSAVCVSLTLGVVFVLIMGFGMSLVMTDLKYILGLSDIMSPVLGIAIGFIGIAGVVAAYPLYKFLYNRQKKKIAPEILRLTEELMENEGAAEGQ